LAENCGYVDNGDVTVRFFFSSVKTIRAGEALVEKLILLLLITLACL
jgi:hypothetical protein